VRWWAERQPDRVSETSPAPLPMARLLRNYGRLLLPRWNELSARSKEALLELLPAAPWAVPLLEQLGQEPTEQLRRPAQNRLQAVQPSAEEPLPLLRFHSLGGFEVWIGTERVPEKSWRGNRNKYLFAYLACSQRPVSEDRLIDLFWEEDLEKGKRGLYNSISHLRKILSAVAPLRDGDYNALLRAGEQIGINPGLEQWHDRVEVERALAEFRKTPALESAEALLDALALVHGPMLDGCFLDWALDLRNSLEQKLIEGAGQLAEWLLANGHTRRLPDLLNRGLEIDPCSHALMRVCLKAALLDGNTGEALRKYELFAKRLKADLELEPSLELVELYQRVRAHV
jgi:LuxR family maltose regulon positive regulatory protein